MTIDRYERVRIWHQNDAQRHERELERILNGPPSAADAIRLAAIRRELSDVFTTTLQASGTDTPLTHAQSVGLCAAYRTYEQFTQREREYLGAVERAHARGDPEAIRCLQAYNPVLAAAHRPSSPEERILRERHQHLREELMRPELSPQRPEARKSLRRVMHEMRDIANLASDYAFRDAANDDFRIAATKYAESQSAYRKRFYMQAMTTLAAIGTAAMLTFGGVRIAKQLMERETPQQTAQYGAK